MKGRVVYFDYLRIVSIFAVVVLHTASKQLAFLEVGSTAWSIHVFYDSMVRFCVPVFVMISGALLLGAEYKIKDIYKKRVPRMLTAFVVWSLFYAVTEPNVVGVKAIILQTMKGYYHLWFIPMLIGLYISIPILSYIVKNEVIMKYFMLVIFLFGFLSTSITSIINDFGSSTLIEITQIINQFIGTTNIRAVSVFFGYFVLGYYLHNNIQSKQERIRIVLLGIASLLYTFILTVKASEVHGVISNNYFSNNSVNVLLVSIMVFVVGKYHLNKFDNKFVREVSKSTFGVYLIHAFVLTNVYHKFGMSSLHPLIAIPMISCVVFFISLAISYILNKLPLIKKIAV